MEFKYAAIQCKAVRYTATTATNSQQHDPCVIGLGGPYENISATANLDTKE